MTNALHGVNVPTQGDRRSETLAYHSVARGDGADVLILTATTGGGHDSVAIAIAQAIHELAPAVGVRIFDPLTGGAKSGLLSAGRWYDAAVAHAPWLWGAFYRATNTSRMLRLGMGIGALLWASRLRCALQAARFRLVVSVHPLCTRLAGRVLRAIPGAPPLHCVVTDLVTIHGCWADVAVDAYYVATPEARGALSAMGVSPNRIHLTGLPLRAPFAHVLPAPASCGSPRVLVLGGGHPSRRFERVVRALAASHGTLRPVVVCGRNARLQRRLARAVGSRAIVLGWRDNIAALMQWSNVIVTKGGSVTLAEAFSQGRPLLIYELLPGQEDGNAALVARVGQGGCVRDLAVLPSAVDVLASASSAERMAQATWWGGAAQRVAAQLLAARVDGTGVTDRRERRYGAD